MSGRKEKGSRCDEADDYDDEVNGLHAELSRLLNETSNESSGWGDEPVDLTELVRIISEDPGLKIFDGHIHMLGTWGSSYSYQDLANRLLRESRRVGASTAISHVRSYVARSTLPLEYASVLSGTRTDEGFTFSNGVRIVPLHELGNSAAAAALARLEYGAPIRPGAALVCDYAVEKRHYRNTDAGPGLEHAQWPPHQVLEDTQLLISLARPSDWGIARFASTVLVPEELTFLESGVGWALSADPGTHLGPELIGIDLRKADKLLSMFASLEDDVQDRLRIVLRRLNNAKIDPDFVDKSISLRICVENMFFNPGEDGMRRRVVETRMPILTSFSKTRSGKVYQFLSGPVHSGRPPSHPELTVGAICAELNQAAVLIIRDGGYPTWDPIPRPSLRARLRKFWRSLRRW